jgi:hypothetical protein
VTHLRVTFFAEWLLYITPLIRQGRYVVPFDAERRFAPMPASDIVRVVVGIDHPHRSRDFAVSSLVSGFRLDS